jgi:hypothetical protein
MREKFDLQELYYNNTGNIEVYVFRAHVPNGWLVTTNITNRGNTRGNTNCSSVFIPDIDHEWNPIPNLELDDNFDHYVSPESKL